VTTPESLYLLLTSVSGRRTLSTARTLIIDEVHALAGNRRGAHLALSIERLEALAGAPLQRIGLSATQKPIDEVARFLVGGRGLGPDGTARCTIVDQGHRRAMDLGIELPGSPLEAVMATEVWQELYVRLTQLIEEHRTTLIFVNTRRLAERVTRHLSEKLGEDAVASHHGSLAAKTRLDAEERLKAGKLRALVATAIARAWDRHRSRRSRVPDRIHALLRRLPAEGRPLGALAGAIPKARIFPLSRDELLECAALLRGISRRRARPAGSARKAPRRPRAADCSGRRVRRPRRRRPVRALPERLSVPQPGAEEFDAVVRMLAEGFSTRRGRRGALIHYDAVHRRIRARGGTRLLALTSGGAIPDTADYSVALEPAGTFLGTVNEDFAVESMAGDIFQLGNASWRILRVERGTVRVEDAHGQPPTVPFWLGEAPARTPELSAAVGALRDRCEGVLSAGQDLAAFLESDCELNPSAAHQLADYLSSAWSSLGALPGQQTVIAERFFDEAGGMQLVLHSPRGTRVNRAWGLALRKRFCRTFNFELQAAATEDAIVLSLGPQHSFPLDDVFHFLASKRRATCSSRRSSTRRCSRCDGDGTRRAPSRWRAGGVGAKCLHRSSAWRPRTSSLPCSPTSSRASRTSWATARCPTIRSSTRRSRTASRRRWTWRRSSPYCAGSRTAKCDASRATCRSPPSWRRKCSTRSRMRFSTTPPSRSEGRRPCTSVARSDLRPRASFGALDREAIERVRAEAWPQAENPDEAHDALLILGLLREDEGAAGHEGQSWTPFLERLREERRAGLVALGPARFWVAAERLRQVLAARPEAVVPAGLARPSGGRMRPGRPSLQ
jgi:ATP-dependent Lhr-like helicase